MSETVYVIAEIGINHNGQPELARALVNAAANTGAYGIKFQYRDLDQIYVSGHREIGDEILNEQIERTHLPPKTIIDLANYAHSMGLTAGISFFNSADMDAFSGDISVFDFYKVPSAELTNLPLIEQLCTFEKPVYISTGGHSELEIEDVLGSITADNWVPMHCVSNYPTSLQNARLGYIDWLRKRWNRAVGYSSHDSDFEVTLLAMQAGAKIIERHITMDKNALGLDHTSSSTPDEFRTICRFANAMGTILSGNVRREPNQGERMNIQNLGRSFYFGRSVRDGERLKPEDLVYRSPKVSIDYSTIGKLLGHELVRAGKKDQPLTQSHIDHGHTLSDHTAVFARKVSLGVPVRFHDLDKFQQLFNVGTFEFHLSYAESLGELTLNDCKADNAYSIHLPDYINSDHLIDIFSESDSQREISRQIVEAVASFAERLQDLTGKSVPVIGSFSEIDGSKDEFYARHRDYFEGFLDRHVNFMPQWLPPIAWYFGGSVPVSVFNDEEDIEFMNKYEFTICLDISHYLLGANYHGFDKERNLSSLLPRSGHIHISDSLGIDGEGLQVGEGDPENLPIILRCLKTNCSKIIEIWQGHLDDGRKVVEAMERLEAAC